jgi:hypothetical protein
MDETQTLKKEAFDLLLQDARWGYEDAGRSIDQADALAIGLLTAALAIAALVAQALKGLAIALTVGAGVSLAPAASCAVAARLVLPRRRHRIRSKRRRVIGTEVTLRALRDAANPFSEPSDDTEPVLNQEAMYRHTLRLWETRRDYALLLANRKMTLAAGRPSGCSSPQSSSGSRW